jgi:hypothetical protein
MAFYGQKLRYNTSCDSVHQLPHLPFWDDS